jgi:hypothetical protein
VQLTWKDASTPVSLKDEVQSTADSENRALGLFVDFVSQERPHRDQSDIEGLVNDISQVSLSATTPHLHSNTTSSLFASLILTATRPPKGVVNNLESLHLPPQAITERVVTKYLEDVLPELPFLNGTTIKTYVREAYESSAYALFFIHTVLATTALCISPSSTKQSASLYITGLHFLEQAFATEENSNPLRDLESVILLAQYAAVAGEDIADVWALTGIALRICIDLGFHKVASTEKTTRLFWSAYSLDRSIAIALGYPFGVSDDVIAIPVSIESAILVVDTNIS